jgi:hypothetical protein
MKILLLCEPRSGSTNLANWFFLDRRFTVLFLPTDPFSKWYRKEHPKLYKYNTEHLLIKEDFYHFKDYSDLIETCDKSIFLYRKNQENQIKSWCNSKKTGNWENEWIWVEDHYSEDEEKFFVDLKNEFSKMISTNNGLKISYEDLYEDLRINKIIDYLEIEDLNKQSWPFGKKYRIDDNRRRNII